MHPPVILPTSPAELAALIDHALLSPTLRDAELQAGCALAAKEKVASVCAVPFTHLTLPNTLPVYALGGRSRLTKETSKDLSDPTNQFEKSQNE